MVRTSRPSRPVRPASASTTSGPAARRRTTPVAAALVVPLVLLAGCTGGDSGAVQAVVPTASASAAGTGLVEPGVPTDLTADVLLTDGMFTGVAAGVAPLEATTWQLPPACGALALPDSLTATGAQVYGDGDDGTEQGVQQVVVLPDAPTAVDVVAEIVAALEDCAGSADAPAESALEDVAVGAQGHGFVTAAEPGDEALGTYTVLSRRGTAVTVVATTEHRTPVGEARRTVTNVAQQAWLRLCRYSEDGC